MNSKLHRIRPLQPGTKISFRQKVFRFLYPFWSLKVSLKLRLRRLNKINNLLDGKLFTAKRVLEIGCANGQDFVKLFKELKDMEIYGMDLIDYQIQQDNFTFVLGDCEHINYPDKFFDVVISIGVLEHVQPIEKLSRVIAEISRVSKTYCVIVPSIGTVLEPHVVETFWQLRDHNRKTKKDNLNYFSDESWLKFEGFRNAGLYSFWYLPLLIKNLAIYKN